MGLHHIDETVVMKTSVKLTKCFFLWHIRYPNSMLFQLLEFQAKPFKPHMCSPIACSSHNTFTVSGIWSLTSDYNVYHWTRTLCLNALPHLLYQFSYWHKGYRAIRIVANNDKYNKKGTIAKNNSENNCKSMCIYIQGLFWLYVFCSEATLSFWPSALLRAFIR